MRSFELEQVVRLQTNKPGKFLVVSIVDIDYDNLVITGAIRDAYGVDMAYVEWPFDKVLAEQEDESGT